MGFLFHLNKRITTFAPYTFSPMTTFRITVRQFSGHTAGDRKAAFPFLPFPPLIVQWTRPLSFVCPLEGHGMFGCLILLDGDIMMITRNQKACQGSAVAILALILANCRHSVKTDDRSLAAVAKRLP
jgi:hypothetical protein